MSRAAANQRTKTNQNQRTQVNGWTPLHNAAFSGRVLVVSILLENGADRDARDTVRELFVVPWCSQALLRLCWPNSRIRIPRRSNAVLLACLRCSLRPSIIVSLQEGRTPLSVAHQKWRMGSATRCDLDNLLGGGPGLGGGVQVRRGG